MSVFGTIKGWLGMGTKAVPASLSAWLSEGDAGAGATLANPYAASVWVSSAIKHCASPIAAVPLVFRSDARGGTQVIDDATVREFWEKPGKTRGGRLTRADLIEATVTWLKLRGESFWILDDSWLTRRAKSPLIVARPDEMREILQDAGDGRELIGWEWRCGAGHRQVLLPEQVVHLKCFNPYDDFRGLAEWEAAKVAADSDYAAGVFARNLMRNNGDRGPYVIGKGGTASPEQVAQITSQLRAKREQSRRGEFRPIFLTGDIEVKEPGLQAVDAAFVAQRVESRHEIYAAFGVPMSFAEVMQSYSIGSASDRYRLIEDTCQPLGVKIADGAEHVTGAMLGGSLVSPERVYAEFDWDEHSTMQAVRRERLDAATKIVDRGVPWVRASEYLRLGMPRFAGDDVGRIPFSLQAVEDGNDGTDETDGTDGTDGSDATEAALDDLAKLLRMPVAKAKPDVSVRAGVWQLHQRKRLPWERKFQSSISRLLMDARAETLRKLAEATGGDGKAPGKKAIADALSVIFDLGSWISRWVEALGGISRAAVEAAGAECWTEDLQRDDPFQQPAGEIAVAMANRQNRIRGAGTQVWDRVKGDIQGAIDSGATNDQLAEAIRKSFRGIDRRRAGVIAATETTVAYETARDMAFRQAGTPWTQWLHSGLIDHARETHIAAHGQIREAGELFQIGLVKMRYPGDPDAPANEVINCRCVRVAVAGPSTDDIVGNDPDAGIPY